MIGAIDPFIAWAILYTARKENAPPSLIGSMTNLYHELADAWLRWVDGPVA